MLLIRNSQILSLGMGLRAGFTTTVVAHLRRSHAPLVRDWSDTQLDDFASRIVARGDELGVSDERSIARLATLALFFGERLERSLEEGWATQVLAHPHMPGRLKIETLVEQLLSRSEGRPVIGAS